MKKKDTPRKHSKKRNANLSTIDFKTIFKFEEPKDVQHFKEILQLLLPRIDVRAYKDNYFKRRVHAMMRRLKINTYQEFAKRLRSDPQLVDQLIKNLSINVTSFFRNYDTYMFIKDHVLKDLIDRAERRTITIWSAGCASGAEPYSLAILFSEFFPHTRHQVSILGTDLNPNLLELARKGQYREEEIVEVPPHILNKYFRKIPETRPRIYHLNSNIKNMVHFKQHDLTTSPPIKNVDLILCRNVMIYFSQEQNQKVYHYFQQALKPGGYVVIGQSEILPFNLRDKFAILNRKHRVFKYTP